MIDWCSYAETYVLNILLFPCILATVLECVLLWVWFKSPIWLSWCL